MRTILSRALAELNAHRSVVLVTIVAEQGSAPRGPGSQMLVGADGQLTGTIGGGQVERQSELLALSLLKEQRSQIQHFALTQAGADSLGMACGGDVTVLFQFISPEDILWQRISSQSRRLFPTNSVLPMFSMQRGVISKGMTGAVMQRLWQRPGRLMSLSFVLVRSLPGAVRMVSVQHLPCLRLRSSLLLNSRKQVSRWCCCSITEDLWNFAVWNLLRMQYLNFGNRE